MSNTFMELATQQLNGGALTRDEALIILRSHNTELMDLIAAGSRLRYAYFGNTVTVNYLVNVKSGLCPEDCHYCSQRIGSEAQILKYSWLSPEEVSKQASMGINAGASRVCLVASGRGPSERDIERINHMVGTLTQMHPHIEVCACLGLLKENQAEKLKQAGVFAYNHNINTSESKYSEICSTHDFQDRVHTVNRAKTAGLSPCSGLIAGMGETDEELVDAVFALRELESESIPVNFLMPFDGTPLQNTVLLSPTQCLRILAMVRFACPRRDVRVSGGREMNLRSLQPFALHLANSLFLGDYLTSEGQSAEADLSMIKDAGFQIKKPNYNPGHRSDEAQSLPEALLGSDGVGVGLLGSDGPPILPTDENVAAPLRKRGAGTTLLPNA